MAEQHRQSKFGDIVLWIVAVLLLGVAIAGNWYFTKQFSAPVRAVGVIVVIIVALLVWLRTKIGKAAWKLGQDARIEMRKVVWPTRQETVQSTVLVLVIVALVALLLWGVDSVFALIISRLIF